MFCYFFQRLQPTAKKDLKIYVVHVTLGDASTLRMSNIQYMYIVWIKYNCFEYHTCSKLKPVKQIHFFFKWIFILNWFRKLFFIVRCLKQNQIINRLFVLILQRTMHLCIFCPQNQSFRKSFKNKVKDS